MGVMPDRKTTLLLIDDEAQLLEVLAAALSDAGYICLCAGVAESALKLLDKTPEIDVIISDIRMPGMDGIELLKVIRERYRDRNWLQVIFVTGHATLANSIEALRLDAADFLYKPVRRQQLVASVEKAVAKSLEQRQTANKWSEGHARVGRLMEEAQKLSEMLGALKSTPFPTSDDIVNNPQHNLNENGGLGKDRMLELLRTWDVKTRHFSDRIFADPAWLMLLDLMENHLQQKQVSVSSLYIVSGVSATTAARRLEEMEEVGLVARSLDPHDGRRQLVLLSEKALQMITNYLNALDKKMQRGVGA